MNLKFLKSESQEHQGYGAGPGTVDSSTYECPCGKGTVVRVKDNIPGFRDSDIHVNCESCRSIYTIDGDGSGLSAVLK